MSSTSQSSSSDENTEARTRDNLQKKKVVRFIVAQKAYLNAWKCVGYLCKVLFIVICSIYNGCIHCMNVSCILLLDSNSGSRWRTWLPGRSVPPSLHMRVMWRSVRGRCGLDVSRTLGQPWDATRKAFEDKRDATCLLII